MIGFVIALGSLVGVAVIIQLLTNMKIVGGNELGIVSGTAAEKGFRTLSGGRAFIIPLLQRFSRIDLTPITIEVVVDSAIAAGIVPLNVKATISFAIAHNELGRSHAVTRISHMAADRGKLTKVASDIIEGHLRDSIASMTPEQVMKDKDILVAKMINACKDDLENIGLEITTMNIADVDDHRLPGVEEPDLYIALLKRVQSVAAETRARQAQAEAKAASAEQSEGRRAETEVKSLSNELESLKASTRVAVKQEVQRQTVGVEEASRDGAARVAGIRAEIEAEKQKIEMLQSRFKAEIVTPASAQAERMILDAKAEAVRMTSKAQAELDQLAITLETLSKSGPDARKAWLIDNFDRLFAPFAETLASLPAERITVLTGSTMGDEPLSAIHPNAAAMARNELIAGALAGQGAAGAAAASGTPQVSGPAAQQGGPGKPRS
jgi:regulator of protease activity HflC (stomatin/prohibitin superfamily)